MIEFFAPGMPATKGSSKAFVVGGRAIITNDAGPKAKGWAAVVSLMAQQAMASAGLSAPMIGPLRVNTSFYLPRPRPHFTPSGMLRPDAPVFAPKRPDGDKLVRCAWDAMTGIAFLDDAQIVEWWGQKLYAGPASFAGVGIKITRVVL